MTQEAYWVTDDTIYINLATKEEKNPAETYLI